MKTLALVLLILFTATLSYAQVYKWVDEKGIVHFTDDMTQIPEKYRRTSEEREATEEKIETKEKAEVPQKKQADSYKDRLGRGEEYWKGRVEESRKKLQSLQDKVESLRVKYNELTEKFNTSKSSAERAMIRNDREQIKNQMDELRVQIGETKEMLERKIPEEASLYRAKPEWVKP
jgi:predicted  nucleic acid-binding Zn-ribbon protein